jgi:plastocyanin
MLNVLRRDRRVLALLTLTIAIIGFSSVSALASGPKLVKVNDQAFSVRTLRIQRGTSVRWNWVGVLLHNVTVKSGPSKFQSATQALGSFSHVFRRQGTYRLYCTLHTFMKMTVIVR